MSQTRLIALGLIALVAVVTALVALRDGSEVTAQPPDIFDRLDEVQDDLVRLRSDVEGVRSELTLARGELGAIRGDIAVVSDRLGRLTRAIRPSTSEPAAYTQALVEEAIARYERDGLDATVARYNTPESVNGQWYVVIIDETDTILALATRPDTVGQPSSDVFGPDGYPVGALVDAVATRDGAWVDYLFANPENGATELKHAWAVRHDGLVFLSGWYEPGPSPVADPAAYTQGVVDRGLQLYRALGRERDRRPLQHSRKRQRPVVRRDHRRNRHDPRPCHAPRHGRTAQQRRLRPRRLPGRSSRRRVSQLATAHGSTTSLPIPRTAPPS